MVKVYVFIICAKSGLMLPGEYQNTVLIQWKSDTAHQSATMKFNAAVQFNCMQSLDPQSLAYESSLKVFNRPGVAGAVLQTPS